MTQTLPSWLSSGLVAQPARGAVTGHLQLLYPQLEIEISSVAVYPRIRVSWACASLSSTAGQGDAAVFGGFDGWEYASPSERFRWTKGKARLGVPIPERDGDLTVSILMSGIQRRGKPYRWRCVARGGSLAVFIRGSEKQRHSFVIPI